MNHGRIRLLSLVGLISLTALLAGGSSANAQQAGANVVFVVPAGTSVTASPTGDVVIFIGQPPGFIDARDCVSDVSDADPRPVQSVVLVDAGSGQRPTRMNNLIVLSSDGVPQTTAVRNGTRIGNLLPTNPGQCSIGGQTYDRYQGIVEYCFARPGGMDLDRLRRFFQGRLKLLQPLGGQRPSRSFSLSSSNEQGGRQCGKV